MKVMMNNFISSKIKASLSGVCLASCILFAPLALGVVEAADISLPQPQIGNGVSVMQALAKRHTSRSFADADITPTQLSHIL